MFKLFSNKSQNNNILFLALILLIILFLGWFFYINNKNDVTSSNINIAAVNRVSENHYSVEYNSDHTKLILTNKLYKFTLLLPVDWEYELYALTETPDLIVFRDSAIGNLKEKGLLNSNDGINLTVDIRLKSPDISFEEFAKELFNSVDISQKTMTVDQMSAIEFQQNVSGHYTIGTYILNNNDVYYIILDMEGIKDVEKYKAIYKEIISSLTFSD